MGAVGKEMRVALGADGEAAAGETSGAGRTARVGAVFRVAYVSYRDIRLGLLFEFVREHSTPFAGNARLRWWVVRRKGLVRDARVHTGGVNLVGNFFVEVLNGILRADADKVTRDAWLIGELGFS